MADELKFPDPNQRGRDKDALDSETTRLILKSYSPPVRAGEPETAYWTALENRIMAGVRTADKVRPDEGWWSVLNGWSRIGLVAATAIFAIGGLVINEYQSEPDEQVAYESVVQTSPEAIAAPAQLITASNQSTQRDAALQYVLSY